MFLVFDSHRRVKGLVCPRCLMCWPVDEVEPQGKRTAILYAYNDPDHGLKSHLMNNNCQPVAKREKKVTLVGSGVQYSKSDFCRLAYLRTAVSN